MRRVLRELVAAARPFLRSRAICMHAPYVRALHDPSPAASSRTELTPSDHMDRMLILPSNGVAYGQEGAAWQECWKQGPA